MSDRACGYCGLLVTGQRRKYCSDRCADRGSEQTKVRRCTEPGCDRPHRARGYCGSHWNQRYGKPRQAKQYECQACGAIVWRLSSRQWGKLCDSSLCKSYSITGRWPSCALADRPIAKPVPEPKRLRKRWYAGYCRWCQQPFIHDQPQTNTCSDACCRKSAKERRRMVKLGAFVAPVYRKQVYERDGWRCRLCGKLVDRTKAVPHPKAPTIDHIVPLSKGGTHEPANVQCAHFLCNSLKGDRGGGEQLLLIG